MSNEKPKEQEKPVAPPSDPEFEKRANLFLKEYGELVQKHKVDIAAYPVYMPNEKGQFMTVIQQSTVDTSKKPYRSTFMEDDAKEESAK